MGTTPVNSINEATTGVCGFTATSFTSSAVTQYDVIVGGANTYSLGNVAPSATSGVPLISQGNAANPTFGTAVVAGGGTGDTSFTAYSVICGGTTSTGNLQNVSGLGSSGQVLTSNGAAALPTWQATAAGKSFSMNRQVFTSNGTYTPTAGMVYCDIEVVGGGGGSGGIAATGSSTVNASGGAGAGGYSRKLVPAATIGVSKSVTVGAGGSGGAAGNNNGSAGGASSVGAILSANGGNGSPGNSAATLVTAPGVAGGTASGGDINVQGNAGNQSQSFFIPGGLGSFAIFGLGGAGYYGGVTLTNGAGYGAGGSGDATNVNSSAQAGENGSAGVVVITEYIFA